MNNSSYLKAITTKPVDDYIDPNVITISSLDEVDAILNKKKCSTHRPQIDTTFQDLFGDDICAYIMQLQRYWEQFGFIDMNTNVVTFNILNVVKTHVVSLTRCRDEIEDDEEFDDEEQQ
jgi:hypothetical protein